MAHIADLNRAFHLQLLPIKASPQRAINFEIVEYSYGQHMLLQQNLMSLGAETELPEICDAKDVTIAVLEGQGSLLLNEEVIPLEPGRFVFIPAEMPHTVRTQTSLVFLLSRCESDSGISESAWMINL